MPNHPVNKSIYQAVNNRKRNQEIAYDNKEDENSLQANFPFISMVVCTMRQNCMKNIFENYSRQKYNNKEMIVILNKNDMELSKWQEKAALYKNVKMFQLDEKVTLGNCMNFGVSQSSYEIIAKIDDDDYYGPKYLLDSVKAFQQYDADIVGKAASFVYFKKGKILAIRFPYNENRFVFHMDGPTLLIKRSVFEKVKFANIPKGIDTQFSKDCVKNGFKIYSTNRFHHVYIRNESSKEHTWRISDKNLLKWCRIIRRGVDNYNKFADI